jgi:tRNA threonylcarbamoyladenosine biosynthesis protein TsaB
VVELSIDTSTRFASVGLSIDGESVTELAWRSDRNHSVELTPAIREVMSRRGVEMADLTAIFIARGPGGFSALRVGMSTAKAMADTLDIALISVPTLDIEAQPYRGLGPSVCAVMPAGRERVYFAAYGDSDHADPPEYHVCRYEDLAGSMAGRTVLCGEAAGEVASALAGRLGDDVRVAGAPPPTRRAGVLARIAHSKWIAGLTDDPTALQPIYLRSTQVEVANRTKSGKAE